MSPGRRGTVPVMGTGSRLAALASVVVWAAAISACGGGEASVEDFRSEANAICREGEEALGGLGEPSSPDQVDEQLDLVLGELDSAEGRFQDLELPGGDQGEQAARFVELFSERSDAGRSAIDDLRGAIEAQDQQGLQRAGQRLQALDEDGELEGIAGELDLEECR